jgi:Putative transposase
VAISNNRLKSLEDGKVSFEWKDYADGNRTKTMTLDAIEFIRRFLLHVPPSGFVRIRHFGFLANRVREQKLTLIRMLLKVPQRVPTINPENHGESAKPEQEPRICPICKIGRLISVEPFEAGTIISLEFTLQDTS